MKFNLYWIAGTDRREHAHCAAVILAASNKQAFALLNDLPGITGHYTEAASEISCIQEECEEQEVPQVLEFMEVTR